MGLVKYVGLARLCSSKRLNVVICEEFENPGKDAAKQDFVGHVQEVLLADRTKMKPNVRVKLAGPDYLIYMVASPVTHEDTKTKTNHDDMMVHIVVTSPKFEQARSIDKMFAFFLREVHDRVGDRVFLSCKRMGSTLDKNLKIPVFRKMLNDNSSDKLEDVSKKVEEVQKVASQNLNQALANYQTITIVEDKAKGLLDQSEQFNKSSFQVNLCETKVKNSMLLISVSGVMIALVSSACLILSHKAAFALPLCSFSLCSFFAGEEDYAV